MRAERCRRLEDAVASSRNLCARRTPTEVAVIGLVIFVCAAFIGTDGWRTWQARQVQLEAARIVGENMTRSLAQHAELSIAAVDLVLTGIVERLERDGPAADLD